jgi:acyl dehydratase
VTLPTLAQAALIYRLSGDDNPLHVDPAAARAAGFPRPILHGLCTLGVATRAILRGCCDNDPARLAAIHGRFTAPVFPGDVLRTDIWREGDALRFRTWATARGSAVLEGTAEAGQPRPAPGR